MTRVFGLAFIDCCTGFSDSDIYIIWDKIKTFADRIVESEGCNVQY